MERRAFLQRVGGMAAGAVLGGGLGRAWGAGSGGEGSAGGRGRRPNVVLIMADDMGYSDIGCYGGEIRTPNLDRLAGEGVRFTSFYNAGRCCPTRASLLTGLGPHEAGMGDMVYWDRGPEHPGYQKHINRQCVTLGEVLGSAGYRTLMAGKWHVGHAAGSRPHERGFERFYGIHLHVDSYWKVLRGCPVWKDGEVVIEPTAEPENELRPGEEWYTTDVFTDWALKFLEEEAGGERPFFLYLAYNSPHWPLEAPEEDIARYRGRYREGWGALRREKYERMVEMGLVDGRWELPEDDGPAWEGLSEEDRDNLDFRRAIYAAQIDRMDQNIGRVIGKLEEKGVSGETLIIFLSDNGCSAEPESEMFGYSWEENRVGNFADWRKNSGRRGASQGLAWANASNVPFRKYKRWAHEGGIATPLIAWWPGVIEGGRLVQEAGHVKDIMATLVEVAGAEYPREYGGEEIRPMRGVSLVGAMKGGRVERGEALCWEHEGNRAIRVGRWKLSAEGAEGEWELYDLEADRTEVHDLAGEQPGRVAELAAAWERWGRERMVLPWPWKEAYGGEDKKREE